MGQGYSRRIDTDEFKKAMRAANRTYVITILLTLVLLPPAVTVIAALLRRESLPILIAACIIVWVITAAIAVYLIAKRFLGKSWDGTVTRQYTNRERRNRSQGYRKVYITEFETDAGRRRRFKERTYAVFYRYLSLGDRVRYHPQLSYPFEKLDKSGDERVICPFCGQSQAIELDTCGNCGKPLLK